MNAKERIIKTIRREPADRVPVTARMWKFLRRYYAEIPDPLDRYIKAQEEFGIDIWHYAPAAPHPCFSPMDTPWRDDITVEVKERSEGGKRYYYRTIYTPKGTLHDVKRRMIISGGSGSGPEVVEPLLKDLSRDLDLLTYMHAAPAYYGIEEAVTRQNRLGDRGLIVGNVYSPIDCRSDVLKQEDFLMLYYDDRKAFEAIIHLGAQAMKQETQAVLDAGFQVIQTWWFYASPSAGWSPAIYEECFLPHLREHVRQVHDSGALYVYYDDGKLSSFMDFYVEAGVDCVMTCTPPPMGDADPASLKDRYGDKVCLMGGVDAVNEVYLSSPEDIRRMVRERLEIFKPGGGYILDGSNSLVWETPVENVRAFVEAGLQYGRY